MSFHKYPLISEMSLYIESTAILRSLHATPVDTRGSCALLYSIIWGGTCTISILSVPPDKHFQNNLIPEMNIRKEYF